MLALKDTVLEKVAAQYKAVERIYGHDTDLHFRAQNFTNILFAISFLMFVFIIFFIFSQEQYIENQTKIVFGPSLVVSWLIMLACAKLATLGHFKTARAIFLIMTTLSIFAAISLTGGFPNAVSLPVIFIPVVLFYCLIGGRTSTYLSLGYAVTVGLIGFLVQKSGIVLPNFTSTTNPFVNAVAVYATTTAVIIMAFVSFDRTVRVFSRKSEAALESKSQFLANMSHEIRTPMNGVIGLADLLTQTELNAQQTQYVTAINQSGQALLTIINDILDFSKIEAGKLDLDVSPFDLNEVITNIGMLLSTKIDEKNLQYKIKYAPDLPRVFEGDDGRIRQILLNLVGNAVKFTKTGSVTVQVLKSASGRMRIEVQDTGIGIADEHIEAIFDKFSQAESSTARTFGGTGLGLAISQKLVQLMGGKIGVTSTLGTGSTFWFEIPLPVLKEAEIAGGDRRETQIRRRSDTADNVPVDDMSTAYDIIFVSNSKNAIESNRLIFKNTDYIVKYMSFSRSLIELLNAIVKMERPLPVMVFDTRSLAKSAAAFFAKIKNHKQLGRMPVVALINNNDKQWNDDALKSDYLTFVACPYVKGQLLAAISTFTQSAKIERASTDVVPIIAPSPVIEAEGPPIRADIKKIQVLVAEDNRINKRVIQNILTAEDIDVTFAYSGTQVLDFCRASIYDVIIMDMAMPAMSSKETIDFIRQTEEKYDLKTVSVIGMKPPHPGVNLDLYHAEGFTDFLAKPIQKDEIISCIQKHSTWKRPKKKPKKKSA